MDVNLGVLEELGDDAVEEILRSWDGFCALTDALVLGGDPSAAGPESSSSLRILCRHGLGSLVQDHFLHALEEAFKKNAVSRFWQRFDTYCDSMAGETSNLHENWPQEIINESLEEICLEKIYQEKCLLNLIHSLQSEGENISSGREKSEIDGSVLLSKYQLMVSSVLLATLPCHFPEILHLYFKNKLGELSTMMAGEFEADCEIQINDGVGFTQRSKVLCGVGEMDIDESYHKSVIPKNNKLVKSIGKVVRDLRSLGFTSMTEDAYASAIFLLLKNKVHSLAGDDYRRPVLESIKEWIQLDFVQAA